MKKSLLKMTHDESDVVELCLRSLTDEQIEDCRAEILYDVIGDLQHEDYETLLVQTMAPLLKRHIRKLRLERLLHE
jgi:hypothetical protein